MIAGTGLAVITGGLGIAIGWFAHKARFAWEEKLANRRKIIEHRKDQLVYTLRAALVGIVAIVILVAMATGHR